MEPMIYREASRKVLATEEYKGFRWWIISLGTHPCAYVELANRPKEYIKKDFSEISIHGGITYVGNDLWLEESGKSSIKNTLIIGWDYAHCLDFYPHINDDGRRYPTEEIFEDVKSCIEQIINLNL